MWERVALLRRVPPTPRHRVPPTPRRRAELEAERILDNAQERLTELLRDIGELKRQRVQFLSLLKGTIDHHQALIAVAEAEGSGKLEDNLAVLRRRTPPPVSSVPSPAERAGNQKD
jgi:hypothetical protein